VQTLQAMKLRSTDIIREKLQQLREKGKKMFITSSFQTQSMVLLHIISQIDKDMEVFFINTGYHFPETIVHKNFVASTLGLQVKEIKPLTPKSLQRDAQGNLLFTFDPDYCCYLNKVQPLEQLIEKYDIWISGVRADQSEHRNMLSEFEPTRGNAIRYHPLLRWTHKDVMDYVRKHDLPVHPLEARGYISIGCEPCTRALSEQNPRNGRWFGMRKTECGLNNESLKNPKGQ